MRRRGPCRHADSVATYLLCHRHGPAECPVAFAAWKGFSSPLRGGAGRSSCPTGEHRLWWTVEAHDEEAALALLPRYVAARAKAVPVRELLVP